MTATRVVDKTKLLERLARDGKPNYSSLSATEFRYKEQRLLPYLSEEAFTHYKGEVEAGIVRAFANRNIVPQSSARVIERAAAEVTTEEVYLEEGRTQHDIIALVNMLRSKMGADDESKSSVHKAATSYDTIDTANACRYGDAFRQVIIPDTAKFLRAMIGVVRRESGTVTIGRSHLQHGEPITFGFSQAWFVDRLGGRMLKMMEATDALVGKFSGSHGGV